MNVSLPNKLEKLIEPGRYRSASEVVREAQLQSKPQKDKDSKDSTK